MANDVIDLEERRKKLLETVEEEYSSPLYVCTSCEDSLFWIVRVEGIDELGLICQHCHEPIGIVFLFEED